ncbi:hypothetical protein [Thermohalobacter berrensis]|uniref:Uncharacterized protein n=1 Tax=Thermohalobacter berrensis TaxID=99594 RepID=A0A419TAM4_9FIRM|nr:hypothetical protein [Thermohalobacter berrensis]RKD34511.1 hypothetical protein BET03_01380 [Thermohalobacter berrensis]
MELIDISIIILLVFLAGYSIGRRQGIKEGFIQGSNYAPISIRNKMLKKGKCPICNKEIENQ